MSSALSSIKESKRRIRTLPLPPPPEAQRQKIATISKMFRETKLDKISSGSYKLVDPKGRELEVPPALLDLLKEITEVLALGKSVTVVPLGKLLTTQQAANILNVSRQYLVRLLQAGKIPFTKTGKHRRLQIQDILVYRKSRDETRRLALDELAELTQEAGGYPELG